MNAIYTLTASELKAHHLEAAMLRDGMFAIFRDVDLRSMLTTLRYEVEEPSDFYIKCHNMVRSGTIVSYEVRAKGEHLTV